MQDRRNMLRLFIFLILSLPATANETIHSCCGKKTQLVTKTEISCTTPGHVHCSQSVATLYAHGRKLPVIHANSANTTLGNSSRINLNGNRLFYEVDTQYGIHCFDDNFPIPVACAGGIAYNHKTASSFYWLFQNKPASLPQLSKMNFLTATTCLNNLGNVCADTAPMGGLNSRFMSPNPILWSTENQLQRRDPYIDITNYKARSIPYPNSPLVTTCSITSGSETMTLGVNNGSQILNGDSVRCDGAGPPPTVAAPTGLSVEHYVNAGGTTSAPFAGLNAGTTTYAYKVMACDKFGGCSATTPAALTTTGAATLGRITAKTTSMNLFNNVLTVETATDHHFSPKALVYIQYFSSNTPLFEGFYTISSTPTATIFTISVPFDSRVPGTPTSDTSAATVVIFNCNRLQWKPVVGAWKYVIYGRRGAEFKYIGTTKPLEPFFDDYGSPMMDGFLRPSYIPAVAPSSASNQYLLATVKAGGGTTTLTVTPRARNTVSGATARMGSDAGILAAFMAAAGYPIGTVGGEVRIPTGTFYLAGFFTMPAGTGPHVKQLGDLNLSDTFDLNGVSLTWEGIKGGSAAQFGWETDTGISGNNGAFPMFYNSGGGAHLFSHLQLQDFSGNGGLIFLEDNQPVNESFEYLTWVPSMGTPMSQMYESRGGFSFRFHKNDFLGAQYPDSTEAAIGYTFLPGIVFKPTVDGNSYAAGDFVFDQSWFVGRSAVELNHAPGRPGDPVPSSGLSGGFMNDIQTQNLMTPLFETTSYPTENPINGGGGFYLTNITAADFPTAIAASFINATSQGGIFIVPLNALQGNHNIYTGIPLLSGYTIAGFNRENNNYGASYGKFSQHPTYGNYNGGYFQMSENMDMPAGHGITLATSRVGAPILTNGGAGNVSAGTHSYQISTIGADGGESVPGFPKSITLGSASRVKVSWADIPGVVGYRVYRDGGPAADCGYPGTLPANNCIDNLAHTAGNTLPTLSATGLPSIYPGKITTQKLIFASPTAGSYGTNTLSGRFTADRTITIPDATFTMAQLIAKGTSILGTSPIAATSCAPVVTSSATGVTTADVISYSFNAAPSGAYANGLFIQSYLTPENVNFLVCNPTAASLTPPSATLNWRVSR
jgi:hypothetical protein